MSDEEPSQSLTLEDLQQRIEGIQMSQRVVVLPKERDIHRFTGAAGALKEFLDSVEEAWVSQAITDPSERIRLLRANLSVNVRDELDCHPEKNRATADQIFGILAKVYGDRRSVCELLTSFNGIHQRETEGVREYANRLNRAFRYLKRKQEEKNHEPLGDAVLRDHFVGQLQTDALVRQLRESIFQDEDSTFFEIREEALRFEASDGRRRPAAQTHAAAATPVATHATEEVMKQLAALNAELIAVKQQLARQSRGGKGGFRGPSVTPDGKPICFKC
ncbi:hypothetical protein ACOMHN_013210 [Nucella lapillus]